jgi:hypothetical protein
MSKGLINNYHFLAKSNKLCKNRENSSARVGKEDKEGGSEITNQKSAGKRQNHRLTQIRKNNPWESLKMVICVYLCLIRRTFNPRITVYVK